MGAAKMLDRLGVEMLPDGMLAERAPDLSVVVPCYNEIDSLTELHRRVAAACTQVVGDSFEIVLVNDGSRDETWNGIQSLVAADCHVVGANLSRNYGHQIALSAGLTLARGKDQGFNNSSSPKNLVPKSRWS